MVFLHLAFDGVQKVRFAQAGAAPDEQRVICPGGVCCHGLCGCVRKFVGRTHNKVFKGEGIVPAGGGRLRSAGGRGRSLLRQGELYFHFKAQKFAEGVLQKLKVAVFQRVFHKFAAHAEKSLVSVEGDRLDVIDEKVVRCNDDVFFAVFLYCGEYFIKRIHVWFHSLP